MKRNTISLLCVCSFLLYNFSCKSNDGLSVKEFVKNSKNNNCINSFFGTRLFNRGKIYFINIPKYNDYLLAFRQVENGKIILLDSATTYYGDSNIKAPIPHSVFQKVRTDLDSFKNLIRCYDTLNVHYINSYKEEADGILEFFVTNDNVIYYIPNIGRIDPAKKSWLMKNTEALDDQWFWYKKKPNTHKSIWEAMP